MSTRKGKDKDRGDRKSRHDSTKNLVEFAPTTIVPPQSQSHGPQQPTLRRGESDDYYNPLPGPSVAGGYVESPTHYAAPQQQYPAHMGVGRYSGPPAGPQGEHGGYTGEGQIYNAGYGAGAPTHYSQHQGLPGSLGQAGPPPGPGTHPHGYYQPQTSASYSQAPPTSGPSTYPPQLQHSASYGAPAPLQHSQNAPPNAFPTSGYQHPIPTQNGKPPRRGSTSSSSSSSYIDISRRYPIPPVKRNPLGAITTFFTAPSESRRKVRGRKSSRTLRRQKSKSKIGRCSNSSSEVDSDLAYGTGYLRRKRSKRRGSRGSRSPRRYGGSPGRRHSPRRDGHGSPRRDERKETYPPLIGIPLPGLQPTSTLPGSLPIEAVAVAGAAGAIAAGLSTSRKDSSKPPKQPKKDTEKEILKLGEDLHNLAKRQNRYDLEEAAKKGKFNVVRHDAGRHGYGPKGFSGSTSPVRGIPSSRPEKRKEKKEDDGWETSDSDDTSSGESVDEAMAFGEENTYPSWKWREPSHPPRANSQSQSNSQHYPHPPTRKSTIVDPKLFGPQNSLQGVVTRPVGFGSVDDLREDGRTPLEPPNVKQTGYFRSPLPSPKPARRDEADVRRTKDTERRRREDISPVLRGESSGNATGELRHVFPMPTDDPGIFDVARGSVSTPSKVEEKRPSFHARTDSLPLRQPKPMSPVRREVYDSPSPELSRKIEGTKKDRKDTSDRSHDLALGGLAGAALAAAIAAGMSSPEIERYQAKEKRTGKDKGGGRADEEDRDIDSQRMFKDDMARRNSRRPETGPDRRDSYGFGGVAISPTTTREGRVDPFQYQVDAWEDEKSEKGNDSGDRKGKKPAAHERIAARAAGNNRDSGSSTPRRYIDEIARDRQREIEFQEAQYSSLSSPEMTRRGGDGVNRPLERNDSGRDSGRVEPRPLHERIAARAAESNPDTGRNSPRSFQQQRRLDDEAERRIREVVAAYAPSASNSQRGGDIEVRRVEMPAIDNLAIGQSIERGNTPEIRVVERKPTWARGISPLPPSRAPHDYSPEAIREKGRVESPPMWRRGDKMESPTLARVKGEAKGKGVEVSNYAPPMARTASDADHRYANMHDDYFSSRPNQISHQQPRQKERRRGRSRTRSPSPSQRGRTRSRSPAPGRSRSPSPVVREARSPLNKSARDGSPVDIYDAKFDRDRKYTEDDAENIYEEIEHSTAPLSAAAIGTAIAAVHADEERHRGDSHGHVDPVQEEADRYYREMELARKIAKQHDNDPTPRVVTPPAMDHHSRHQDEDLKKKEKGPYAEPDADFRFDHEMTPDELPLFTPVALRKSFSLPENFDDQRPFDPRIFGLARPILNIVRATPPPEKQAEVVKLKEPQPRSRSQSRERKPESSRSADQEEDKPSYGRSVTIEDAAESPSSTSVSRDIPTVNEPEPSKDESEAKSVSWGTNETQHYVPITPYDERRDPHDASGSGSIPSSPESTRVGSLPHSHAHEVHHAEAEREVSAEVENERLSKRDKGKGKGRETPEKRPKPKSLWSKFTPDLASQILQREEVAYNLANASTIGFADGEEGREVPRDEVTELAMERGKRFQDPELESGEAFEYRGIVVEPEAPRRHRSKKHRKRDVEIHHEGEQAERAKERSRTPSPPLVGPKPSHSPSPSQVRMPGGFEDESELSYAVPRGISPPASDVSTVIYHQQSDLSEPLADLGTCEHGGLDYHPPRISSDESFVAIPFQTRGIASEESFVVVEEPKPQTPEQQDETMVVTVEAPGEHTESFAVVDTHGSLKSEETQPLIVDEPTPLEIPIEGEREVEETPTDEMEGFVTPLETPGAEIVTPFEHEGRDEIPAPVIIDAAPEERDLGMVDTSYKPTIEDTVREIADAPPPTVKEEAPVAVDAVLDALAAAQTPLPETSTETETSSSSKKSKKKKKGKKGVAAAVDEKVEESKEAVSQSEVTAHECKISEALLEEAVPVAEDAVFQSAPEIVDAPQPSTSHMVDSPVLSDETRKEIVVDLATPAPEDEPSDIQDKSLEGETTSTISPPLDASKAEVIASEITEPSALIATDTDIVTETSGTRDLGTTDTPVSTIDPSSISPATNEVAREVEEEEQKEQEKDKSGIDSDFVAVALAGTAAAVAGIANAVIGEGPPKGLNKKQRKAWEQKKATSASASAGESGAQTPVEERVEERAEETKEVGDASASTIEASEEIVDATVESALVIVDTPVEIVQVPPEAVSATGAAAEYYAEGSRNTVGAPADATKEVSDTTATEGMVLPSIDTVESPVERAAEILEIPSTSSDIPILDQPSTDETVTVAIGAAEAQPEAGIENFDETVRAIHDAATTPAAESVEAVVNVSEIAAAESTDTGTGDSSGPKKKLSKKGKRAAEKAKKEAEVQGELDAAAAQAAQDETAPVEVLEESREIVEPATETISEQPATDETAAVVVEATEPASEVGIENFDDVVRAVHESASAPAVEIEGNEEVVDEVVEVVSDTPSKKLTNKEKALEKAKKEVEVQAEAQASAPVVDEEQSRETIEATPEAASEPVITESPLDTPQETPISAEEEPAPPKKMNKREKKAFDKAQREVAALALTEAEEQAAAASALAPSPASAPVETFEAPEVLPTPIYEDESGAFASAPPVEVDKAVDTPEQGDTEGIMSLSIEEAAALAGSDVETGVGDGAVSLSIEDAAALAGEPEVEIPTRKLTKKEKKAAEKAARTKEFELESSTATETECRVAVPVDAFKDIQEAGDVIEDEWGMSALASPLEDPSMAMALETSLETLAEETEVSLGGKKKKKKKGKGIAVEPEANPQPEPSVELDTPDIETKPVKETDPVAETVALLGGISRSRAAPIHETVEHVESPTDDDDAFHSATEDRGREETPTGTVGDDDEFKDFHSSNGDHAFDSHTIDSHGDPNGHHAESEVVAEDTTKVEDVKEPEVNAEEEFAPVKGKKKKKKKGKATAAGSGSPSNEDSMTEKEKESFLANAGTLGAGVGRAATVLEHRDINSGREERNADSAGRWESQPSESDVMEMVRKERMGERETEEGTVVGVDEEGDVYAGSTVERRVEDPVAETSKLLEGIEHSSSSTVRGPDGGKVAVDSLVNDSEVVEREVMPGIDPQFGDLLPLPPSSSPVHEDTDGEVLHISLPLTPGEISGEFQALTTVQEQHEPKEKTEEVMEIDPEIQQRDIRPSIDPQFGDLLPLPPSQPGSPVRSVDDDAVSMNLPDSPPESPAVARTSIDATSPQTPRKKDITHLMRSPSISAVPLKFLLGNRSTPSSPVASTRSTILTSPTRSDFARPEFTPRAKSRHSWDSSKELQPLQLLERRHSRGSSLAEFDSRALAPLLEGKSRDRTGDEHAVKTDTDGETSTPAEAFPTAVDEKQGDEYFNVSTGQDTKAEISDVDPLTVIGGDKEPSVTAAESNIVVEAPVVEVTEEAVSAPIKDTTADIADTIIEGTVDQAVLEPLPESAAATSTEAEASSALESGSSKKSKKKKKGKKGGTIVPEPEPKPEVVLPAEEAAIGTPLDAPLETIIEDRSDEIVEAATENASVDVADAPSEVSLDVQVDLATQETIVAPIDEAPRDIVDTTLEMITEAVPVVAVVDESQPAKKLNKKQRQALAKRLNAEAESASESTSGVWSDSSAQMPAEESAALEAAPESVEVPVIETTEPVQELTPTPEAASSGSISDFDAAVRALHDGFSAPIEAVEENILPKTSLETVVGSEANIPTGYNEEQLELARQMKDEFDYGSLSSKKSKKKKNGKGKVITESDSGPSTTGFSTDAPAEELPMPTSDVVVPTYDPTIYDVSDPTETLFTAPLGQIAIPAYGTQMPDLEGVQSNGSGVDCGFTPDALAIAEFGSGASGSSKKSKKKKGKGGITATSNEGSTPGSPRPGLVRTTSGAGSFNESASQSPRPGIVMPAYEGGGLAAEYFAGGPMRTPSRLASPPLSADGFSRGFTPEQLEQARLLKEEFSSGGGSKKGKKDKKSLLSEAQFAEDDQVSESAGEKGDVDSSAFETSTSKKLKKKKGNGKEAAIEPTVVEVEGPLEQKQKSSWADEMDDEAVEEGQIAAPTMLPAQVPNAFSRPQSPEVAVSESVETGTGKKSKKKKGKKGAVADPEPKVIVEPSLETILIPTDPTPEAPFQDADAAQTESLDSTAALTLQPLESDANDSPPTPDAVRETIALLGGISRTRQPVITTSEQPDLNAEVAEESVAINQLVPVEDVPVQDALQEYFAKPSPVEEAAPILGDGLCFNTAAENAEAPMEPQTAKKVSLPKTSLETSADSAFESMTSKKSKKKKKGKKTATVETETEPEGVAAVLPADAPSVLEVDSTVEAAREVETVEEPQAPVEDVASYVPVAETLPEIPEESMGITDNFESSIARNAPLPDSSDAASSAELTTEAEAGASGKKNKKKKNSKKGAVAKLEAEPIAESAPIDDAKLFATKEIAGVSIESMETQAEVSQEASTIIAPAVVFDDTAADATLSEIPDEATAITDNFESSIARNVPLPESGLATPLESITETESSATGKKSKEKKKGKKGAGELVAEADVISEPAVTEDAREVLEEPNVEAPHAEENPAPMEFMAEGVVATELLKTAGEIAEDIISEPVTTSESLPIIDDIAKETPLLETLLETPMESPAESAFESASSKKSKKKKMGKKGTALQMEPEPEVIVEAPVIEEIREILEDAPVLQDIVSEAQIPETPVEVTFLTPITPAEPLTATGDVATGTPIPETSLETPIDSPAESAFESASSKKPKKKKKGKKAVLESEPEPEPAIEVPSPAVEEAASTEIVSDVVQEPSIPPNVEEVTLEHTSEVLMETILEQPIERVNQDVTAQEPTPVHEDIATQMPLPETPIESALEESSTPFESASSKKSKKKKKGKKGATIELEPEPEVKAATVQGSQDFTSDIGLDVPVKPSSEPTLELTPPPAILESKAPEPVALESVLQQIPSVPPTSDTLAFDFAPIEARPDSDPHVPTEEPVPVAIIIGDIPNAAALPDTPLKTLSESAFESASSKKSNKKKKGKKGAAPESGLTTPVSKASEEATKEFSGEIHASASLTAPQEDSEMKVTPMLEIGGFIDTPAVEIEEPILQEAPSDASVTEMTQDIEALSAVVEEEEWAPVKKLSKKEKRTLEKAKKEQDEAALVTVALAQVLDTPVEVIEVPPKEAVEQPAEPEAIAEECLDEADAATAVPIPETPMDTPLETPLECQVADEWAPAKKLTKREKKALQKAQLEAELQPELDAAAETAPVDELFDAPATVVEKGTKELEVGTPVLETPLETPLESQIDAEWASIKKLSKREKKALEKARKDTELAGPAPVDGILEETVVECEDDATTIRPPILEAAVTAAASIDVSSEVVETPTDIPSATEPVIKREVATEIPLPEPTQETPLETPVESAVEPDSSAFEAASSKKSKKMKGKKAALLAWKETKAESAGTSKDMTADEMQAVIDSQAENSLELVSEEPQAQPSAVAEAPILENADIQEPITETDASRDLPVEPLSKAASETTQDTAAEIPLPVSNLATPMETTEAESSSAFESASSKKSKKKKKKGKQAAFLWEEESEIPSSEIAKPAIEEIEGETDTPAVAVVNESAETVSEPLIEEVAAQIPSPETPLEETAPNNVQDAEIETSREVIMDDVLTTEVVVDDATRDIPLPETPLDTATESSAYESGLLRKASKKKKKGKKGAILWEEAPESSATNERQTAPKVISEDLDTPVPEVIDVPTETTSIGELILHDTVVEVAHPEMPIDAEPVDVNVETSEQPLDTHEPATMDISTTASGSETPLHVSVSINEDSGGSSDRTPDPETVEQWVQSETEAPKTAFLEPSASGKGSKKKSKDKQAMVSETGAGEVESYGDEMREMPSESVNITDGEDTGKSKDVVTEDVEEEEWNPERKMSKKEKKALEKKRKREDELAEAAANEVEAIGKGTVDEGQEEGVDMPLEAEVEQGWEPESKLSKKEQKAADKKRRQEEEQADIGAIANQDQELAEMEAQSGAVTVPVEVEKPSREVSDGPPVQDIETPFETAAADEWAPTRKSSKKEKKALDKKKREADEQALLVAATAAVTAGAAFTTAALAVENEPPVRQSREVKALAPETPVQETISAEMPERPSSDLESPPANTKAKRKDKGKEKAIKIVDTPSSSTDTAFPSPPLDSTPPIVEQDRSSRAGNVTPIAHIMHVRTPSPSAGIFKQALEKVVEEQVQQRDLQENITSQAVKGSWSFSSLAKEQEPSTPWSSSRLPPVLEEDAHHEPRTPTSPTRALSPLQRGIGKEDSGYVPAADESKPRPRSWFDPEYVRDSGVQLREKRSSESQKSSNEKANTDDVLARRSWPPVDDVRETVDLRRKKRSSLKESQSSPYEKITPGGIAKAATGLGIAGEHKRSLSKSPALSESPSREFLLRKANRSQTPSSDEKSSSTSASRQPRALRDGEGSESPRSASDRQHQRQSSLLESLHHDRTDSPRSFSDNIHNPRTRTALSKDALSREEYYNRGASQTPNSERGASGLGSALSRPGSVISNRSGTPSLRRVSGRASTDLRATSLSQRSQLDLVQQNNEQNAKVQPRDTDSGSASDKDKSQPSPAISDVSSSLPPNANEGRQRVKGMAEVYNGFGEGRIGSPRSPTRPHSMRRKQSMQLLDMQAQMAAMAEELAAARQEKLVIQQAREAAERNLDEARREASKAQQYKAQAEEVRGLLESMTLKNTELTREMLEVRQQFEERDTGLQATIAAAVAQAIQSKEEELATLRQRAERLSHDWSGDEREIDELEQIISAQKQEIAILKRQSINTSTGASGAVYLAEYARDDAYFELSCQKLFRGVWRWIHAFSDRRKHSTADIEDIKSLDDPRIYAWLKDSFSGNPTSYLSDLEKRRLILMSLMMALFHHYIFQKHFFGLDEVQTEASKVLEMIVDDSDISDAEFRHWRATQFCLFSKSRNYSTQRNDEVLAVTQSVMHKLSSVLPQPSNSASDEQRTRILVEELKIIVKKAAELSNDMRRQIPKYIWRQSEKAVWGERRFKAPERFEAGKMTHAEICVQFMELHRVDEKLSDASISNEVRGGLERERSMHIQSLIHDFHVVREEEVTEDWKIGWEEMVRRMEEKNRRIEEKGMGVRLTLFPMVVREGDETGAGAQKQIIWKAVVKPVDLKIPQPAKRRVESVGGSEHGGKHARVR